MNCSICRGYYLPQITLICEHSYCQKCLDNYLGKKTYDPKCVTCNKKISKTFIRDFFQHRLKNLRFTTNSSFCPSILCKGRLINNVCNVCKMKVCINCEKKKHIGFCEIEELLSVEYLDSHMFRCPKCNIIIEHNGGCNTIICICGSKFRHDNDNKNPKMMEFLTENEYLSYMKNIGIHRRSYIKKTEDFERTKNRSKKIGIINRVLNFIF